MNRPTDQYAWIKAKGGMGNRMLCAASGMLWAELAGRVPFIDWRDDAYSLERENSIFHFFDPPGALREPPLTEGRDVVPAVWKDRLDSPLAETIQADDPSLHSSAFAHRRYSIDARRTDQPEAIAVFWHYTGRFEQLASRAAGPLEIRTASLRSVIGAAMKRYLPPVPSLRDRIDRFRNGSFGKQTVGVHVRYTDRTTNLDRLLAETARLAGKIDADTVFLATDNAIVSERFASAFPRVVETEKWLPEPGQVMHQNAACADRKENGMEALTDMNLLAACDGLVYASRSTFSVLSHCIGEFKQGTVIDIDRRDPKIIARKLARRVIA